MSGTMNPFRSEKFIITIQVGLTRYKILQIIFGKKDGSLFVNFPYYKHSEGLVSLVTFPKGHERSQSLSLEPGGRVTSHLVKYSHHPDGVAHFSQTGRVLSVVRKKAIPLAEEEGHIFTTQLQYLKAFEMADKIQDRNKYDSKRSVINFSFNNDEPEAIKIVGRWYSIVQLLSRIKIVDGKAKIFGPKVPCETEAGKRYVGFLTSPREGSPLDGFALLVTCEAMPRLDKREQTALTFIGGFDPPHIVNNLNMDTTFLALSYPTTKYTELSKSIGSIDIT